MDERLRHWGLRLEQKVRNTDFGNDPAHDLAHFRRVVATATALARDEGANQAVILPAAWLHDLVNVPKNDPRRSIASRLSAEQAMLFLKDEGYDLAPLEAIAHAIEAHSFSANITPTTLEARIVQDADRLDGLGAIGVARVFAVGGILGRRFYDPADPFAKDRVPNDLENTIDHFYVKLFRTVDTLQTQAGRTEGARRAEFMQTYLDQLRAEIGA